MNITDLAIVTDHPLRRMVPKEYTIREGGIISYEKDGEVLFHVAGVSKGGARLRAALNNLGGARFEREYPGMTGLVFKWQVEAEAGRKLQYAERKIIARYKELTHAP